jgi:hypothetical protein
MGVAKNPKNSLNDFFYFCVLSFFFKQVAGSIEAVIAKKITAP